MNEFWYDYVKPKYGEKGTMCCIDTDSFKDIAQDVETRFDVENSNYE